jgi:hypothetical protein
MDVRRNSRPGRRRRAVLVLPIHAAQFAVSAAVLAVLAAGVGPSYAQLGGPHGQPMAVPADPSAQALAMRAYDCVGRATWVAGHGRALPDRMLMVRATEIRHVPVPTAWQLAAHAWTTVGWCRR